MKRIFAILTLLLMFGISGEAFAEGTGLYATPKFIMSIQDTGTVSKSWPFAGSGVDDYSQFTLGGGLAVGYDFWPQQMIPLRVELEFALRGNSERTWSDQGRYMDEVKGVWNNSTLFGNLYWDFHNDSAFTPYIGGGIGMAFNYTGYDIKGVNGDKISMDDRNTNFAWNAGAGVSYSFNDQISVDAAYRFVGLGYNEVSTTYRGANLEIGNEPYNNEFMLGLRFAF